MGFRKGALVNHKKAFFLLLALLVGAAVLPARASVSWTGPGWYLEDADQTLDDILVSGPYSDEDDCEADQPDDTDDDQYLCAYEETDPTVSDPPTSSLMEPFGHET